MKRVLFFKHWITHVQSSSVSRLRSFPRPPDNTAGIRTQRSGFNRHEQNVYFLPILVVDSGPPSLSSTGTLTIHVCGCDTGENWNAGAAPLLTLSSLSPFCISSSSSRERSSTWHCGQQTVLISLSLRKIKYHTAVNLQTNGPWVNLGRMEILCMMTFRFFFPFDKTVINPCPVNRITTCVEYVQKYTVFLFIFVFLSTQTEPSSPAMPQPM